MSDDDVLEPDGAEDDEPGHAQRVADGSTPPYMSFTGFLSILDKMVEHGPPDQIDRAFFGSASGSKVAQTLGALRFFDLLDGKKPQPLLAELVPQETRRERLRKLIEAHYSEAVALGSTKATQAQLDEVFKVRGLRGSGTLRKAVTFYLQAAEYTGIPVSPYFSRSRPSTTSGGVRRTNGAPRKTAPRKATAAPPPSQRPADDATLNLDEKKGKYIDLLLKLAERQDGTPDEDVLDRLHTVLGYGDVSKTARRKGRSAAPDRGGDNNG